MGNKKYRKSNTHLNPILWVIMGIIIFSGAIYFISSSISCSVIGNIPDLFGANSTINGTNSTSTQSPIINNVSSSAGTITITNNPKAQNVLLQKLKAFILRDETDNQLLFGKSREDKDIAVKLHDNAEKEGIRTALVVLTFYDNPSTYVLNAFETIDRGLIYIDCNSRSMNDTTPSNVSYDKIAYIEKGREYGAIDIQTATSYSSIEALSYAFYENYKKTHKIWYNLPLGIVTDVKIYW